MKKYIAILFFAFMTLSLSAQNYMKVKDVQTNLNVRCESNTNSPIVGKLNNGDVVEIIEKTASDEEQNISDSWMKIRNADLEGWVMCKYLEETEAPNDNNAIFQTIISDIGSIWRWYVNTFWSNDNLLLCIIGLVIALVVIVGIIFVVFYFFHVALYGLLIYIICLFLLWLLVQAGILSHETMVSIAPWGFPLGCAIGIYMSFKDPDEFYSGTGGDVTIVGSNGNPIHQNNDGTWQDKEGYLYDSNGNPVTDKYGSHLSESDIL